MTAAIAVPDAEAAVEAARPLAGHAVALKLDAEGLAHKSDLGLVRLGLAGDDARPRRRRRTCWRPRGATASTSAASSSSRWPSRASS